MFPTLGASIQASTCEGGGSIAGKLEIYRDNGGEYRFRLKATNGQAIGTSERYTSERACENGVQSVMNHEPKVTVEELTGVALARWRGTRICLVLSFTLRGVVALEGQASDSFNADIGSPKMRSNSQVKATE